jgi:hypothetical protein
MPHAAAAHDRCENNATDRQANTNQTKAISQQSPEGPEGPTSVTSHNRRIQEL